VPILALSRFLLHEQCFCDDTHQSKVKVSPFSADMLEVGNPPGGFADDLSFVRCADAFSIILCLLSSFVVTVL
jgi:hypothetical protein